MSKRARTSAPSSDICLNDLKRLHGQSLQGIEVLIPPEAEADEFDEYCEIGGDTNDDITLTDYVRGWEGLRGADTGCRGDGVGR